MPIKKLTGLAISAVAITALAACSSTTNTTGGGTGASETVQTARSNQRVKMSRDEILAAYSGKTLTASDHATTYRAGGTWVNDNGQSGQWTVTSDGILTMTGGVNLRLEVFRVGNRFYHRNVVSGQGGYYTVG